MRAKFVRHLIVQLTLFLAVILHSGLLADVPRSEHPRPDLQRNSWLSLNGEWQFEVDPAGDGDTRGLTSGKVLSQKIVVPFCPESKLSGLGFGNTQKLKYVWYRRDFELPQDMLGKRIKIHFGGVDYQSWVYINGQLAGTHVGESASFDYDITGFLTHGKNEVVLKVMDDMWSGLQPCGKQSEDQSYSCFYTRTTGIWQSVWLEGLGSSFIENFSLVPDPDHSRVVIHTKIDGQDQGLTLTVDAYANGKRVGSETVAAANQNSLVIDLKEKFLWEPGAPFLCDLKFTLSNGSKTVDEVTSYFGLRKTTITGRKFLINDKPVFQRLILDQGFYPDGLWTAPSDQQLENDIRMSMACGFNGARLHQKVFEPRFLYWADKLGYLVWGEYPNAGYGNQREGFSAVVNEWTEILIRDRNHPSIIGWCPFNENFEASGELQKMVWNTTKAIDPTRPALESSGWTHTLTHPELRDAHDYTEDPAQLKKKWTNYFNTPSERPKAPIRYTGLVVAASDLGVPFMVSEIGGIGWGTTGGWSYGNGPKTEAEFFTRYQGTIDAMLDNPNLFGFCYTQLTDIEQEKNGLYEYGRTPKFDVKKLHEITSRKAAYERNEPDAPQPSKFKIEPRWKIPIGAVQDGDLCRPYQYTTEKPANGWINTEFDDTKWMNGRSPFGNEIDGVRTSWKSKDIYLRNTFQYDGQPLNTAGLVIRYDEDTEVYINGVQVAEFHGFIGNYQLKFITDRLRSILKPGKNTIALHTHQSFGGQYIDVALLVN